MMVMGEYKLINEKTQKGYWIEEKDYVAMLEILKIRNSKLYQIFLDSYTFIEDSALKKSKSTVQKQISGATNVQK